MSFHISKAFSRGCLSVAAFFLVSALAHGQTALGSFALSVSSSAGSAFSSVGSLMLPFSSESGSASSSLLSPIKFDATSPTPEPLVSSALLLVASPNPVSDVLFVRTEQVVERVQVVDLAGRELLVSDRPASPVAIRVQSLPAGNYVLRVLLQDGSNHAGIFTKR